MKRYWSSMMMIQNLNGDNDAYVMSNENSAETKCVHFNNWVIVRAGKPGFQFCECVSFDWSVNFTRKTYDVVGKVHVSFDWSVKLSGNLTRKTYDVVGRVRAADMSPNMIPSSQLMRLMTIIGGLM